MPYRSASLAVAGLMLLASVGCAPSYNVRTMAAPKVTLTEFHTFRLLPTPLPRDGRIPSGGDDPMVSNSITNRALRASVTSAFVSRGYTTADWMPDFAVAVYASAYEKLDLTQWQYGYPAWPYSWWMRMPQQPMTQYQEGTVVVDVINPQTLDLIWRGSATATLGVDPNENTKELQKAAVAIVEKFPRAKPGPVVAQR